MFSYNVWRHADIRSTKALKSGLSKTLITDFITIIGMISICPQHIQQSGCLDEFQ